MNTINSLMPLVLPVIIILAYALLMRILDRLAQPKRLEMAHLGTSLIEGEELNQKQKMLVTGMMDEAYSWKVMVIMTWLIMFTLPRRLFSKKYRDATKADQDLITILDNQDFVRFNDLHSYSIFMANPIIGLLYMVQVAFIILVLVVLVRLSKLSLLMLSITAKTLKAA